MKDSNLTDAPTNDKITEANILFKTIFSNYEFLSRLPLIRLESSPLFINNVYAGQLTSENNARPPYRQTACTPMYGRANAFSI
jgi:hypothetical protein